MSLPKIGNLAPALKLKNQNDELIDLKNYRGKKNIVLYFYPKAMTSGCTVQACAIRDAKKVFDKIDTIVFAVSPDPLKPLIKFTEKDQLNFDLLSDEDHEISLKYGVWTEKSMYGRKYMGIVRTSFIINKEGKLVHILEKVNTKTHHEDALNWIKKNL